MFQIILGILAILAAVFAPRFIPETRKVWSDTRGENVEIKLEWLRYVTAGTMGLVALFLFASTSFVVIGQDKVGHLKRIYLGDTLPPGKIIAQYGQKGPQAEILGPGFHFRPFIRVLYEIEELPVIDIPSGKWGFLVTKDGSPLRNNQFIADAWGESNFDKMLDAKYFLGDGKGQKGPQLDVLRPGKYRINQYLFEVKLGKALNVPTGHVAVIRSNVQTDEDCPDNSKLMTSESGKTGSDLSAPLVPRGCIGVWSEPLSPGKYYLNDRAYVPTIIPTRVQTWTYRGGYSSRKINLTVGDDGKIEQTEEPYEIVQPKSAADHAINVRVEGWIIPVDMRVLVQVHPNDAPKVVASVGTLQDVEDKIVTPAIRDILRTIGGHPDRKVLDFIEKRDEIVAQVEEAIAPEGAKAGVTIQEARMGEPAIPPELLVATLRQQLASQLRETYIEEQKAQKERIKSERERATADKQPILVQAEIEKKAASFKKDRLKLEGEGEKLKLIEIAKGQKAQVDVLGQDRVLQLQMLKEALKVAAENPDIVKVPHVNVSGVQGGGTLEGAAAILGNSTLTQAIKRSIPVVMQMDAKPASNKQ